MLRCCPDRAGHMRIRGRKKVSQNYILARENGRAIPKEDKIFGISRRAKAAIAEKGKDAVVNATIGALLDDDGNLIVLDSVGEVFEDLAPLDYAEYAPIGGTPLFREAVQKAAFGNHVPEGFKEAVATPGGTGSLRNVISNYSSPGDRVLTSDWHWAPYNTIAGDIGRSIDTFRFFDDDRHFNGASFKEKRRFSRKPLCDRRRNRKGFHRGRLSGRHDYHSQGAVL